MHLKAKNGHETLLPSRPSMNLLSTEEEVKRVLNLGSRKHPGSMQSLRLFVGQASCNAREGFNLQQNGRF